jgi:hypothetical protein
MIYSRRIFSGLSARRHFSGRSRWRQRGTPSGNRDPNIDGRYWEQIFLRRGHDLCGFWPLPEKYGRFSSGNKRSRTSNSQCTQLGWPPGFVASGCSFPRNGGPLSISPSRLHHYGIGLKEAHTPYRVIGEAHGTRDFSAESLGDPSQAMTPPSPVESVLFS